jgi:hypothetical protein
MDRPGFVRSSRGLTQRLHRFAPCDQLVEHAQEASFMSTRQLDEAELRVWVAFLDLWRRLASGMERQLAEAGSSGADYRSASTRPGLAQRLQVVRDRRSRQVERRGRSHADLAVPGGRDHRHQPQPYVSNL